MKDKCMLLPTNLNANKKRKKKKRRSSLQKCKAKTRIQTCHKREGLTKCKKTKETMITGQGDHNRNPLISKATEKRIRQYKI